MGKIVQAVGADPVFIGNLVAEHIKASYPDGVALVCSRDQNGLYPTDLLESAFGKKATKDLCADITDLAIIRFPAGVTPAQVAEALREAGEETGEDGGFTVYENGEAVIDEVLG